jgi:26S proteasome regulatory subunit N7
LAQYRFLATHGHKQEKHDAKEKLFKAIQDNNMTALFLHLAEDLHHHPKPEVLKAMQQSNEEELKKIEERIEDAEKNLGETEVNDGLVKKAEFFARIGDKDKSLPAYRFALDKISTLGSRIDILFATIRIGFFWGDDDVIAKGIERAKTLVDEGGDWDRRNRLKAYEGTYLLSIRDFKPAAQLFLDSLSTFTSTELMSYRDFVKYAVLVGMISLQRVEIKKRIIDAPEILEVLHEIPHLEEYMKSLYEGHYDKFFKALASIEQDHLRTSRYLAPHLRYYIKEMRIIAYAQLLESYRSLTIYSIAERFGVSEKFIDAELSRFIAAGRLNCVIDKVNGIVETNRPDAKNAQYQAVIKHGDLLLNRVQKLSRVITV